MIYSLHRTKSNNMKADFWVQFMKFCSKVNRDEDPGSERKRSAKQANEYSRHQHSTFCRQAARFSSPYFQGSLFCFLRTIAPGHIPASARKKLFIEGTVIHSLILTYKAIKTRRMGGKEFVYNMFLK